MIDEDLLRKLGFAQQVPPHIWDYPGGGSHLRLYKSGDQWVFVYRRDHSCVVTSFMDAMRIMEAFARREGAEETQDALRKGLGLDRLVENIMDEIRGRGEDA